MMFHYHIFSTSRFGRLGGDKNSHLLDIDNGEMCHEGVIVFVTVIMESHSDSIPLYKIILNLKILAFKDIS